jgi:NAD(P)-dependent dehydrogenase (short-subunit alcohol dehydrogenase family)
MGGSGRRTGLTPRLCPVSDTGMTDVHEQLGLSGKVSVVVGSSKGWGRGVAMALADEGSTVVVNGTDPQAVSTVVDEITARGGKAVGEAVGVHTTEGARRLTEVALERFGRLDVLVNSSGGKTSATILELSEEALDRTIDIQLKAPFLMTRFAAKAMVDSGRPGRIITLSGGAAVRSLYGESMHAATKGGILAATLTWAVELESFGITVNAVRGGVRTPGTGPLIAQIRSELQRRGLPSDMSDRDLGFFEAEEAAPLVVWLASDEASAVTGQFVGIDGPKITIWGLAQTERELLDERGWDVERLGTIVRPELEAATTRARSGQQVIAALNLVGADAE